MRRVLIALPIAVGAVAYVAADNVEFLAPLVFLSLAPLFASLTGTSVRGAWRRGYLFGLVFGLGELFWIAQLAQKWVHSLVLGIIPWLIASVLMAIYFGVFALMTRAAVLRGRWWAIPLIWSGIEILRSYIPLLAFPWGLLASPLWHFPWLIQGARLGTIYLVSAWICAVNWSLGSPAATGRRLGLAGSVLAAGVCVSLVLYSVNPVTKPLRVTIGQTGVDMAFSNQATAQSRTNAAVQSIVKSAERDRSELLVLPEGTSSEKLPGAPVVGFTLDPDIPTVLGAQRGRSPAYQSAVGYDGRRWQSVDKTRLVIFGEFVPGRDFLPFLSAFNLPSGDLTAGEHGTQALHLRNLTVGPVICFEEVFPDIAFRQAANGSRILTILSIDDWFLGTSAPIQFTSAAVWRAVETGLPVARAASLGESIAVNAHGQIIAQAPLRCLDAMTVELPVPVAPTFPFWLPAFPVAALIISVCAVSFKRGGTLA